MKTIKVTEDDGTVRIFNPIHITDVKLVISEYNKEWCIVLKLDDRSATYYTILHSSKEEAEKDFEHINECLESI